VAHLNLTVSDLTAQLNSARVEINNLTVALNNANTQIA